MSPHTPGRDPDNPSDKPPPERNDDIDEDTGTSRQQGGSTGASDSTNTAQSEAAVNSNNSDAANLQPEIPPAQRGSPLREEQAQLADIAQFNELLNPEDTERDSMAELHGLLDSFAPECATDELEELISSLESSGLGRILNFADISEELDAVTANQANEIDSNDDIGSKQAENSSLATLRIEDASSRKDISGDDQGDESKPKPDHKSSQPGKADISASENISDDIKDNEAKAKEQIPDCEGARGPYMCQECGCAKKVLDKNGQYVPHRCPKLVERVENWARTYGNMITTKRLRTLVQEALRRMQASDVTAPEEEGTGNVSPTRRPPYLCRECDVPLKGHKCPYRAKYRKKASKDECKPAARGKRKTANAIEPVTKQCHQVKEDDRKPAAHPSQATAKRDKTPMAPAENPNQEDEEGDRNPAAQQPRRNTDQPESEEDNLIKEPTNSVNDVEGRPLKRRKIVGTSQQDQTVTEGHSAENAVISESQEISVDVFQEETTVVEPSSNEAAESVSLVETTGENAAPMQLVPEVAPHQDDHSLAPDRGSLRGDETDDDFEAV